MKEKLEKYYKESRPQKKMKLEFENYKNVIYYTARKYSQKTGASSEELCSEGKVIFFEAKRTYKEEKGSFSTHLYNNLHGRMRNYLKREYKSELVKKDLLTIYKTKCDCFTSPVNGDKIYFNQPEEESSILKNLSEDIIEILKVLVYVQKSIFEGSNIYRKISRLALKKELLSKGWGQDKIKNSFSEIEEVVR